MAGDDSANVTQLLHRWSSGDPRAMDAVAGIVQGELRKIADGYLRRERADHTLQPTALVNEAWLRLVKQDESSYQNRHRFFALAAQIMRQVLVDHARAAKSGKRGGGARKATLEEGMALDPANVENFLILNDALTRLGNMQPRLAQIIELRYFGGLGVEEVGRHLEISAATVSRQQKFAEALLSQMMSVERAGEVDQT